MKKIISLMLVLAMVFTFAVGCNKKDEAEELNLGNIEEENEEATLEADNGIQTEAKEIDYVLYLKYKDKPFLYDDMYSIDINDDKLKDKSIEEFVLNELINYVGPGNIESPIPEETKVLGIERDGKKVIVDLSEEFLAKKMTSSQASLTIGGIVNTLVVIPGNETVEIKVEGNPLENYYGVDTSTPLYFMEALFPDK